MEGDTRGHYGVHCFKQRDEAKVYLNENRMFGWAWYQGISSNMVLGSVAIWGEIMEHERGYRASFARVTSIDEMHLAGEGMAVTIDELRAKYRV